MDTLKVILFLDCKNSWWAILNLLKLYQVLTNTSICQYLKLGYTVLLKPTYAENHQDLSDFLLDMYSARIFSRSSGGGKYGTLPSRLLSERTFPYKHKDY
jgi:hypothetical protein